MALGEINEDTWVCLTCSKYIKRNKIPPLSILTLNSMEERLIALNIPFMQIRSLPRGRQQGLRGNIVNVRANITDTTPLPRTTANCQTMFVSLKWNLAYNYDYWHGNFRPQKLLQALNHLCSTSDLYKERNISVLVNEFESVLSDDLKISQEETCLSSSR